MIPSAVTSVGDTASGSSCERVYAIMVKVVLWRPFSFKSLDRDAV